MISKFFGAHRFLSNFYFAPVHAQWQTSRVLVPTIEHAYQAEKAETKEDFDMICASATTGQAKRAGKIVRRRPDFDNVKLAIMERLVTEKFASDPLKAMLLATGNEELVEGNNWGDVVWGICNGKGENHLGKLLMKVRTKLLEEK